MTLPTTLLRKPFAGISTMARKPGGAILLAIFAFLLLAGSGVFGLTASENIYVGISNNDANAGERVVVRLELHNKYLEGRELEAFEVDTWVRPDDVSAKMTTPEMDARFEYVEQNVRLTPVKRVVSGQTYWTATYEFTAPERGTYAARAEAILAPVPGETVDTDGDGTTNDVDNDVDGDGTPNTSDPDADGDGVSDTPDSSPSVPQSPPPATVDSDNDGTANDADSDVDGDGIANEADPDDDNDGTPDTTDATPTVPTAPPASTVDSDGDGTTNDVDTDLDGDGVNNDEDLDDDNDGTPDTGDARPTVPDQVQVPTDGVEASTPFAWGKTLAVAVAGLLGISAIGYYRHMSDNVRYGVAVVWLALVLYGGGVFGGGWF